MSVNLSRSHPSSGMTSSASRDWLFSLVIAAVVGIGLGALVGGLAFRVQNGDVVATALVRVTPPVDLGTIATGTAETQWEAKTEGYVSGEVAYLSGQGFARAVGDALGSRDPAAITVTQNAMSPVLTMTARGKSASDADETVRTAIDVYRQQLTQRTDQQLKSILPTLEDWESAAVEAGDGARAEDVRTRRAAIQLHAAQSDVVEVLQPPAADASAGGRWMIGALFGGIAGGLLAILGLSAYRNRSGRLRSAADVADVVDGFIVPPVDLRQRDDRQSRAQSASLGRTMYAQCRGSAPNRVILLIGASPRSGTDVVASLLQSAAAEHGPAEYLDLKTAEKLPSPTNKMRTLIVDAGALGESALAAEVIRAATDLIVVARLDSDTTAQMLAVRSATASSRVPLIALFTYRPWWSRPTSEAPGLPITSGDDDHAETQVIARVQLNGRVPVDAVGRG
jgi:hypothetical protein